MQRRIMAAFFAGVLFCAVVLGAGVGAFHAFSDDAQAQGRATWELKYFSEREHPGGLMVEDVEAWLNTLPAECSLAPSTQTNLFYYSCPDS